MTSPGTPANIEQLWRATLEKIKVRLILPSVWRAMEAGRPLIIDGDSFVLGFAPSRAHEGGLLRDSKTSNFIERALEEEAGRPLRLRLIEGDTLDDWRAYQSRDQEAAALQKTAQERRRRESSVEHGWDDITERLTRRYAEMPQRQLPQVQALYLEEAVEVLAEAARRLLGDKPSEVDHRSYARVLERVADRAQVPAPVVAWMVRQKSAE